MLFAILVFITALALAGTAAWFSIVGLIAIFAASPTAIAIMAVGLETAKLVTASWLYRNWHLSPLRLKVPLTVMTGVMMIITSIGVFGFLSKAHIEQGAPVVNNLAVIERLDQSITREQRKIQDAERVIAQLDKSVQTLIDYDRIRGPDGAISVRESQKPERDILNQIISQAQSEVDRITDQKFQLESEIRAFEVEVGPIKYVAELLYADSSTETLEKAIQWLIMIIIFVFDPYAVLLLIAANRSLIQHGLKKNPRHVTVEKQEPAKFDTIRNEHSDEHVDKEISPENILPEPEPKEIQPEPESEPIKKPERKKKVKKVEKSHAVNPEKINEVVKEITKDEYVYTKAKEDDSIVSSSRGINGRLISKNNTTE